MRLFAALFVAALAWAQTMIWPVRGARQMIGAANNFEIEAGYRLLLEGGNAIDAGVAATLAAAVTEQARFGLGGEMPLIIKMAGKEPVVISGVGVAPAKATAEWYQSRPAESWESGAKRPPIPGQGLRSAITPGVFDGLMVALETYGTKSFAQVAAPALEYARDGFPLGEEFAQFLKGNETVLRSWPTSAAFFFPGGNIPGRGELWRAPELAGTFEELAAAERKARGSRVRKIQAVRDYFSSGPIARKLAAFSEANGGLIAYNDLKNFKAEIDQPRTTIYRGYTIVKPGFWTQGPVMLQALNILEGYDLKAMGHNSPEYLHTVLEAVKLAFADRDRYYGDPKFSKIPEDRLLSKEYAAARRKLIDPTRASLDSRPGDLGLPPVAMPSGGGPDGAQDTTCVNVVDRWGNAFNATPSGAWLPSVIAGDTGIPYSSRLQSFVLTPGHANYLAPGKRPRVTLSPTMVLKDGKLHLIMSTPGGDNQDQAMLQVLLNVLDFGMPVQEAAEAPRFQTEHFYSSFGFHDFVPGKVNLERRIAPATIESMKTLGHQVEVRGDWSNGSAPTVILVRDGVLDGASDPRRGRIIFGR